MPKGVPNKRYTPEFKKLVVETMMKEKMSYRETARQFEISNHHRVQDWERIYLTEGPEGFAIERRGRGSKSRPPKQLPKGVEEDLLAEVQRLRAENDYLKNLQALVLEDERRQRRKQSFSLWNTSSRNSLNIWITTTTAASRQSERACCLRFTDSKPFRLLE